MLGRALAIAWLGAVSCDGASADDDRAREAYRNRPLPIGEGQTISQPYIVALSTELLEPRPEHVVLEVGTGSGYQAAVLAELVRQVWSIEIVEPLGREAARRLRALGYDNVEVKIGDGYQGWPEKGRSVPMAASRGAPCCPCASCRDSRNPRPFPGLSLTGHSTAG